MASLRNLTVITAISALAGCGDAEACPGTPDPGTYLVSMTLRSGTCPAYLETTAVVDATGLIFGDVCDVTFAQRDACGEDFDQTCPILDASGTNIGTSTFSGGFDYSADGASGILTMNVEGDDGSTCIGTYDVVMSPL